MRKHQFAMYLSIAGLFAVFATLFIFSSGSDSVAAIIAYCKGFIHASDIQMLGLIFLSFCFGLLCVGMTMFVGSAIRGDDIDVVLRRFSPRRTMSSVIIFARTIVPFLVCFILLTIVVGSASVLYRDKLIDEQVALWDYALFRTVPFLLSDALHFPAWLNSFIISCYLYLVPIMFAAIVLFFWVDRNLCNEFFAAFSYSAIFMVIGWLLVPVLTPQDRFLVNIYHLPISPQIALAVQSFHPPETVSRFLGSLFSPNKETSLISSFPSAHVVWAVLVAYYLFRVNRPLGFATLPFFIASSFGTFFLAQHYAVDALSGILVAVVSIILARKVYLKQAR